MDEFILTSPAANKEVMSEALTNWRALSAVEMAAWEKRAKEKAAEM